MSAAMNSLEKRKSLLLVSFVADLVLHEAGAGTWEGLLQHFSVLHCQLTRASCLGLNGGCQRISLVVAATRSLKEAIAMPTIFPLDVGTSG